MGIIELLLLAVGLSMDAFAVSVCKGLAMEKTNFKSCALCGVWFGGFQALMPLIGYALGSRFEKYIDAYAPWVAFALLAFIGGNMIRESLCGKEEGFSRERQNPDARKSPMFAREESTDAGLDVKTMFLMAVATSIDALAVGITFACIPVAVLSAGALANTLFAVATIGVVTFALSCVGVRVGNVFGTKYKAKAEFAGGLILILIGVKILLEHFGVL